MALEKLDIGYIDMMLLHHPGNGDVEATISSISPLGLMAGRYFFVQGGEEGTEYQADPTMKSRL